jgi:hypothetical protein
MFVAVRHSSLRRGGVSSQKARNRSPSFSDAPFGRRLRAIEEFDEIGFQCRVSSVGAADCSDRPPPKVRRISIVKYGACCSGIGFWGCKIGPRPYADDLSGARGGNHVVPHLAQVQPSGRRGTLDDVLGCGRTRSPGNLACARKGCRPGERGHVRHARLAAVGIRDSGGLFFNHPT